MKKRILSVCAIAASTGVIFAVGLTIVSPQEIRGPRRAMLVLVPTLAATSLALEFLIRRK